jgi:uncharacterized coiled-coil protein SlyX
LPKDDIPESPKEVDLLQDKLKRVCSELNSLQLEINGEADISARAKSNDNAVRKSKTVGRDTKTYFTSDSRATEHCVTASKAKVDIDLDKSFESRTPGIPTQSSHQSAFKSQESRVHLIPQYIKDYINEQIQMRIMNFEETRMRPLLFEYLQTLVNTADSSYSQPSPTLSNSKMNSSKIDRNAGSSPKAVDAINSRSHISANRMDSSLPRKNHLEHKSNIKKDQSTIPKSVKQNSIGESDTENLLDISLPESIQSGFNNIDEYSKSSKGQKSTTVAVNGLSNPNIVHQRSKTTDESIILARIKEQMKNELRHSKENSELHRTAPTVSFDLPDDSSDLVNGFSVEFPSPVLSNKISDLTTLSDADLETQISKLKSVLTSRKEKNHLSAKSNHPEKREQRKSQFKQGYTPDQSGGDDWNESDDMIKKLKKKLEQKRRLVKQMEDSQPNRIENRNATIPEKNASYYKPTLSTKLKKRAFYI